MERLSEERMNIPDDPIVSYGGGCEPDQPAKVTYPYGATRKATILETHEFFHVAVDELGEGHVLLGFDAYDETAQANDKGILTFTKGGPTGGYWKFTKGPA